METTSARPARRRYARLPVVFPGYWRACLFAACVCAAATNALPEEFVPNGYIFLKPDAHVQYENNSLDLRDANFPLRSEHIEADRVWIGVGWVKRSDFWLPSEAYRHACAELRPLIENPSIAIEKTRGNKSSFLLFVDSEISNKDIDQAHKKLDIAQETWPDDVDLLIRRGCAFAVGGRIEESIETFTKAIKLEPRNALLLAMRGNIRIAALGRLWFCRTNDSPALELAMNDLNAALEIRPNQSIALAARAAAFFAIKDFRRAIEDIDHLKKNDPWSAEACRYGALIYTVMGKFNEAVHCADELVALDPLLASSYAVRGEILTSMQENQRALDDFTKALELSPNFARAREGRGTIRARMGRCDDAKSDFLAAIQLDPREPEHLASLGTLYCTAKVPEFRDIDAGIVRFIQACQMTQWKNPSFVARLAWAYSEAGDFERAIRYQEETIALGDEDPAVVEKWKKRLAHLKAGEKLESD